MSKSQIQLDYDAAFTPSTAAASMAMISLAVVSTGTWLTMPWWFAAILGTTAALINAGHTAAHKMKGTPHRVTATTAITWAAWTGWGAAILHTNPHTWTPTTWWTMIAGFLVLWLTTRVALDIVDVKDEAHFAETLDNPHANQLSRLEYDRRRMKIADTWIEHIHTATRVRPTITALEEWPNDTGFSLEMEMPTGSNPDAFDTGACRRMASDARLPIGCTVTPATSKIQGHLVLHVMTSDPAATITPFPISELTRISINGGIPWVIDPRSEPITVNLREECALIVGPPGTGKTTLLDAILAGFARCEDVITWGIDAGKRGDAFIHWVENLTPGVNRVVDWVAADIREAERMLDAAERIATTRLTAYRRLMADADTKLLPVSPSIPMIEIVIDEGVNILGSTDPEYRDIKAKIINVMETTRAMGIRLILTATDANVSAISDSRVRKYSNVKVALTSTDRDGTSVQKLFGNVKGLDARQLRAKGSGVIDAGYGPRQCRTWVTSPSTARDVSATTTTYRPTLDQPSVQAAGPDYLNRWDAERTAWWIDGITEPTTDTQPRTDTTRHGNQSESGLTLNLRVRNEDGTVSRRTYPHDKGDAENPDDELFADIVNNMRVADPRPNPTGPSLWERAEQMKNEWRTVALTILTDNPSQWFSTSDLLTKLEEAGVNVARPTLATELASLARAGRINTNGKGGAHTRYNAS